MARPHTHDTYLRTMEAAGFYRDRRPLTGLTWSGEELRAMWAGARIRKGAPPEEVDRFLKYQALLEPEDDGGRLGVDDIFELSGSPCIYFKCLDADPDAVELTAKLLKWQKVVWNHGRAPMLWVVTPTQVRILNAYARPQTSQDTSALRKAEIRCFENIADNLDQLREVASRERIASGDFWLGSGQSIDRKARVDRQLVRDLSNAAGVLTELGMDLGDAHRLLLRGIFVSYLDARGWLSKELLRRQFGVGEFKEALDHRKTAEQLFDWLAETFNGDVFPDAPANRYTADQLKKLKFLLDGGDPESKQRYLWPYEFDVIPIELLSSVYEEFAHALDREEARRQSTHYTPINLVDLTLSRAFNDDLFGDKLPLGAKVLDLACGSGVFLAESLRRLVGRRIAAGEKLNRKLIRDTLYNQIFGVDVNPGAVHVASVSLYLAALELDPQPGSGNAVRFKPLIHPEDDEEKQKKRAFFNLFADDAFLPTRTSFPQQRQFAKKQFAMVVGNPPWTQPTKRKSGTDNVEPQLPSHVQYCRGRHPPIPLPYKNPPDQAFIWRATEFAGEDARIGMLLSARRFFSHMKESVAAKKAILQELTPRLMANLCLLRLDGLFPSSKHPAMVLIASNRDSPPGHVVALAMSSHTPSFKNHGILEIGPERIRRVNAARLARDEDLLKAASWAGPRDMAIIESMRKFRPLSDELSRIGAKQHNGFTLGSGGKSVPDEVLQMPCLSSPGFTPFEILADRLPKVIDVVPSGRMEAPRRPEIYRGPKIVVNLHVGEGKVESAFCGEDTAYSEGFYGIPVVPGHELWASCLNGIINSPLATYFLFLTGSVWGIERDDVKGIDLGRLPVPGPSAVDEDEVRMVIKAEAALRAAALKRGQMDDLMHQLREAAFRLYGLDSHPHHVLVEDMLRHAADLRREVGTPEAATQPASMGPAAYASHFIEAVDEFLSVRGENAVVAEVYELPHGSPLQVIRFSTVPKSARRRKVRPVAGAHLESLLDQIARTLPQHLAERVYVRRHLRVYGQGEVYIIKPAQARLWTRSAGMNDADVVLAEHMGAT